jgi:TonB-linked SusC/RagA family outer membrane protein
MGPSATSVGGGRPGAAPAIVLRGVNSLNATNRSQGPLYIVDGVLLNGSVPDLASEDVENIEVINGAAAASLYGARGGAGVINITTKRGRAQEGVSWGVRTEFGASDIENRWPMAQHHSLSLDPTGTLFCASVTVGGSPCGRYIDIREETKRINDQPNPESLTPQTFMDDFGIGSAAQYRHLTGQYLANPWPTVSNAVNQIVTSQTFMTTSADARGKVGDATNFFASLGNTTQGGAVRFLEGYRRNSARLNLEHRWAEKLTTGMNTYFADVWEDGDNNDNGAAWFSVTRQRPHVDLLRRDAYNRLYIRVDPLSQGSQNANPAFPLLNNRRITESTRFLGALNGRYEALDWLTFSGTFGYDRAAASQTRQQDKGYRSTSFNQTTQDGTFVASSSDDESLNANLDATVRRNVIEDLQVTAAARYSYDQRRSTGQNLEGRNLVLPGLYDADIAQTPFSVGSSSSEIVQLGLTGNLNLEYKGRYIIDGVLRREGSSLYGADNRWATFGRAALRWIASEEPWYPQSGPLNTMAFRASYGTAGIGPAFAYQYETFTIGTGGTLNRNQFGNVNLKPEVKTDIEAGLDLELFNRAALSVTYANSRTENQMLPFQPPQVSGFQTQWRNAGTIQNDTWEASLSLPIITRPDLSYSTRFVLDKTKSTIKRLDIPPYTSSVTVSGNSYSVYQMREGEKIGTLYGTAFMTNCSQLPGDFASRCGGADSEFQRNNDGFIVWVGQGNRQNEGISRNLWTTQLPACRLPSGVAADCSTSNLAAGADTTSPFGVPANWGMPILLRDENGAPAQVALGSGQPDFRLGFAQNFSFKRFTAYALVDASVGAEIWNAAYHWSLGDLTSGDVDQYGKSIEDAKPIGYYWRRGPGGPSPNVGIGGLYDVVGPTNYSVEDNTYAKLRELSVNYRVGAIGGVGDFSLGLIGRNLVTWSSFRGWDPETGVTGGDLNSGALNSVGGYRFPNPRTFTLQLATSF